MVVGSPSTPLCRFHILRSLGSAFSLSLFAFQQKKTGQITQFDIPSSSFSKVCSMFRDYLNKRTRAVEVHRHVELSTYAAERRRSIRIQRIRTCWVRQTQDIEENFGNTR